MFRQTPGHTYPGPYSEAPRITAKVWETEEAYGLSGTLPT